jgi:aspartyl protease family protein
LLTEQLTLGSATKHALREALLWVGVALAGVALIYFYDDLAARFRSNSGSRNFSEAAPDAHVASFEREVRLKANDRGHFVFDASINERPVTLMADTGATLVVLTYEDAERLGLAPRSLDFSGRVQTANGAARVAPITLDRVRVDDITLRDVAAVVADKGALNVNLLGMSFLGRLTRFEMQGRQLVLVQ